MSQITSSQFDRPEWERVFRGLTEEDGVTAFLGTGDSGKTTCLRAAAEYLLEGGRSPVAVVDADIGQASVGPPASVGLALLEKTTFASDALTCHSMQFVGSVSPAGHLLQTIVATKRLVDTAYREGAKAILVDTSGLIVQSLGFHLKLNKLELVNPRHVVALQREEELESLLSVLATRPGITIHRMAVSPLVISRSPAERYRYRVKRFAVYFERAASVTLDANRLIILSPAAVPKKLMLERLPPVVSLNLLSPQIAIGILVGLNDAFNRTLALGLIEDVNSERREMKVLTPLKDTAAVRIVQMGNMRLAENGEEIGRSM